MFPGAPSIVILAAVLPLVFALSQLPGILSRLPPGGLRSGWIAIAVLISVFICAYAVVALLLAGDADPVLGSALAALLTMGAGFVAAVCWLFRLSVEDIDAARLLRHRIDRDELTGVASRTLFEDTFPRAVAEAQRMGTPLSLMVIDIDRFKMVNDDCGHHYGDVLLRAVASRIAGTVRAGDILARFGGDEFVLLAPGVDAAAAAATAARLVDDVAALSVTGPGGRMIGVTVSIGHASLAPGEAAEGLFARADTALYAAKRAGRNCIAAADEAGRRTISRSPDFTGNVVPHARARGTAR